MNQNDVKLFFQQVIETLPEKNAWWPYFLYHFTGIEDIISILSENKLFSRNECKKRNLICTDTASTTVMSHTSEAVKDSVRLYFRPMTPTQYYAEGYKNIQMRGIYPEVNIPVIYFFTFKTIEILTLENVSFTIKNAGTIDCEIYNAFDDLKSKFDYRKTYHNSVLPTNLSEKDDIIKKRCAEVLVKDELSLDYLENIFCRTEAEYNTLIYLLKENGLYARFGQFVGIKKELSLFFKDRAIIIDEVILSSNNIIIKMLDCNYSGKVFISEKIELRNGRILHYWFSLDANNGRYLSAEIDLSSFKNEIESDGSYIISIFASDELNDGRSELIYKNEWIFTEDSPF